MGRVYLDVSCKAGNKDPVNVVFCLLGGGGIMSNKSPP